MRLSRLVFALCFAAFAAHAQQYPSKPVRVLVGYAAGSSTDIVGRVMADRLGAYWKQTVIVENRGGAAGNLAADAVAKAQGDGYTLLFAQNGLAISAAALPNLPYSAERDLAPLAPVAATPHILIVGPDFPAKNVQELITRAKAEPGSISPELGARIARDVEAVLKQPDTREMLQKSGASLFEDRQANFKKFFHADIEKWKNLVKSTNLKLE